MTPQERQQLKELMEWKKQKTEQQISFPLDIGSEDTIRNRGFIIFTDKSTSTITADKSLGIVIGGVKYRINAL